jgi:hypothetical protein
VSTFQDFDGARRERLRALEPIRFRLGGRDFSCVIKPTLADSFELAAAPEPWIFDGTPRTAAVAAITRFIEALLANNRQRKQFQKLLSRRDDPIDAESIIELGGWLAEQFTNRPLDRSNVSSDGPPTSGETSSTSRFGPAEELMT